MHLQQQQKQQHFKITSQNKKKCKNISERHKICATFAQKNTVKTL